MTKQYPDKIGALLRRGADRLVNSPTPMLDARLLLMAAANIDEAQLITSIRSVADHETLSAYDAMIERRLAHEPVAYILGYKEFWKQCYRVSPDVLVPRADSECLIESALEHRPIDLNKSPKRDLPKKILDLGTGSGCLLGSLLGEYPHAFGVGVDVSQQATLIAAHNMQAHGLERRAQIIQGKWFDAVQGQFDIIISNPPYIPESDWDRLSADIRDYEPIGALISDREGRADYQHIFKQCKNHLQQDGLLIVEIGDGQANYLYELALQHFSKPAISLKRDLAGQNRAIVIDNGKN